MISLLFQVVAVLLACVALMRMQRGFQAWERPYLWGSLFAHFVSVYAMIAVTRDIYGTGDLLGYYRQGARIAEQMNGSFFDGAQHATRLLLQLEGQWHHGFYENPSSTTAMIGASAWLAFLFGGSLHAMSLAIAAASFFGKLAIYRVFRSSFDVRYRRKLLIAAMLVPSIVYWSSGLLKESVAMCGVGLLVWGGHVLVRRARRVRGALTLLLGGVLVGVIKPYILISFGVAGGIWYYWHVSLRSGRRATVSLRPLHFVIGAAVALVVVVGLGKVFPRYDVSTISEELARMQGVGRGSEGGSNYELGDETERSVVGQLGFAPLALGTALLRPAVFEARNPQMAVNALEMLALTVIVLLILFRTGLRKTIRALTASPELMFCLAFVFTFALGVGLATTNLGTLSRYRTPMMPFYVTMLLVLLPARRRRRRAIRPYGGQQLPPVGRRTAPEPPAAEDQALCQGSSPP